MFSSDVAETVACEAEAWFKEQDRSWYCENLRDQNIRDNIQDSAVFWLCQKISSNYKKKLSAFARLNSQLVEFRSFLPPFFYLPYTNYQTNWAKMLNW